MLVDNAQDLSFAFEERMPKEKVSKKRRAICQNYQNGTCKNGDDCPDRHIKTDVRTVQLEVCRHWLIGRCVNGENCIFTHEFDERRVPDCQFLATKGECTNPQCLFKHSNPQDRQPRCAAYERGFCPLGPNCKLRHVKKDPCPYYMTGFCPLGNQCELGHPVQRLYDRMSIYARREQQLMREKRREGVAFNPSVICYRCFDPGHIPATCPGIHSECMYSLLQQVQEPGEESAFTTDGRIKGCFLCGAEGHKAKECPQWLALHPNQHRGGGGRRFHNRY